MRVVIGHGFSGFPGIAQGGYVAGVVARLIPGAAEVRLRRSAPLERPLALERLADGSVELREGETVLAEGRPAALDLEIPRRVSEAEAVLGAREYPGHRRHLFPTCYCCGPERGDGLRIFPGPVEGGIVAAPWVPSPSLADEGGRVPAEIVWAALDCPAIWSVLLTARAGATEKIVTGRIHARLLAPVRAGEPHVVIGWPLGTEGNTLLAAAALIAPDGELAAIAKQTCVITGWGVPLDPAVWGIG